MRTMLAALFFSTALISCGQSDKKQPPSPQPQSSPESQPGEGCLCGHDKDSADSQPQSDSQPAAASLYQRVGGDEVVKKIAMGFYSRIEKDPKYELLLDMHNGELGETPQHLYEFLVQWFGGPTLYNDRHGPPVLRKRHTHMSIDANAANLWMSCMKETLEEHVQDAQLRSELEAKFQAMATHLINQ